MFLPNTDRLHQIVDYFLKLTFSGYYTVEITYNLRQLIQSVIGTQNITNEPLNS